MRDSPTKDFSEKEYIGKEKKQCSVLHTLHTLHEKRNVRSIRMRDSIHGAVSRYCAFARITIGQFYEEAAILFMDLNPVNGTVLNIEHPHRDNGFLKDRMLIMMCLQELREIVPVVIATRSRGVKIHRKLLERISKTFDKCYKIIDPPPELDELIEELLEYIE